MAFGNFGCAFLYMKKIGLDWMLIHLWVTVVTLYYEYTVLLQLLLLLIYFCLD